MNLKDKEAREWLRKIGIDGIAKFDLKNKDLILYDGGLLSIRKKSIKRKGKLVTNCFDKDICLIWFDSLDETIDYLIKMRDFLNKTGYSTSNGSKKDL